MVENNGGESVSVPRELVDALKSRIRGSAFPSVEAFVLFVLARLAEGRVEAPFSAEEEEKLKERLRSLGYLD